MNKTRAIPAIHTNGQTVNPKNGKMSMAIHIVADHNT